MLMVKRTQKEVDDLLNDCADQEDEGGSKFFGMTFEQGVAEGIRWILGEQNEHPLGGEEG